MENETRNALGLPQRKKYDNNWDMPVYNPSKNQYYVQPGDFPNGVNYRSLPVMSYNGPQTIRRIINADNISNMYAIYRDGCFRTRN